jgi:cobalt-zinc-cadmium efflux system outer membrane protein
MTNPGCRGGGDQVRGVLALAWMALLLLTIVPGCAASQLGSTPFRSAPPQGVGMAEEESEPQEGAALPRSSQKAGPVPPVEAEEGEGPEGGLTLEAAIERLLSASHDLAAKRQDIPKARADILTAGLRNNPVLFLSASQLPYQQYSPQRPGTPLYDITVVQPLDVSGKHRTTIRVAQHEYQVLEARYQDAVRHEIDRLYTAYVDVLEAQALQRAALTEVALLSKLVETARQLVRQQQRPQTELTAASLRKARAEIVLQRAEVGLRRARRSLAVLLAVAPGEAETLTLRGSLHDRALPPPCLEELIRIALESRPDLASYRLSVERAETQVRQAQAEGIEDVFLFFSPYQASDFSAEGKQSATGFQLGILLPIPALNRNQGNVAHSRANVAQLLIEVESVEQQVSREVRRAAAEYELSRDEVERYEGELLPGVRSVRDDQFRLYASGQRAIDTLLTAQRDYNDVIRQYREALVRHRRSMLALNSAVGQRLLP